MIRRIILAYCMLTTCTVAGQPATYGLVGGTVTLTTNIKDTPDKILWKHKGNKVVEFNGQEQREFGSFSDRITLDWGSADLTISDLSYEDSGEYVLETHNKALYNKRLPPSYYKLEVIDKVAKPTISCEMNTNSSSSTSANQATLMCSSEPGQFQSLMKFEWSSQEKSGQHLTISLGDEHDDKVYTCNVSNPVSKELTTFTAKDCYNGAGPGARNAGSDSDSATGIGIGVAFAIAFVILLMSLLFCKLKHKACFARKGNDEEGASHGETEESEYQKGHTPSRAPTFVSNQPLLPYGKNNTRSKNGEEDESLLNQSERKESNDDTEEESKAERLGNVRQEVERIEEETREQKPEGSIHVTRPHHAVSGEPKKPPIPSTDDKEDTDVTQDRESTENKVSESDPADPEKTNDVSPSALNDDISESDKKADEDEETRTASANAPSAVQPLPEDDEHKEDANSDQDSDKTTTKKNAEESEPSGLQEGNECNGLEEETTSPEQKGAEATVNEPNSKQADVETHSGEDNQQDRHKKVSTDEPDVDEEDNKTGKNLPLENSQQPQSPITPEPDHINTNTCQESSDTEQAASDLEEKENNRDSGNGNEETDEGEAVDKNKVQREPEDEKSNNESFSGDKEVEKKSEAAE